MVNKSGSLEEKILNPDRVLEAIKPGMTIFIGTGVAEPRTPVKHLKRSDAGNLDDPELIQPVSFGDAVSQTEMKTMKYRLKTFFSGWRAKQSSKSQGHLPVECSKKVVKNKQ